jgi:hypothetical protein
MKRAIVKLHKPAGEGSGFLLPDPDTSFKDKEKKSDCLVLEDLG